MFTTTEQMEAGPELDALVAERVLRFAIYPGPSICEVVPSDESESGYPEAIFVPVPPYSTDIAAAWQVVECLSLHISPTSGGMWLVSNVHNRNDPAWIYALAPTAPHAICLAAIKIVAGKEVASAHHPIAAAPTPVGD